MNATSKHYDVVVLGVGLGTLSAAALLARRSWRVLVIGNGHRKATYEYDGHVLARRPFTFLSATSPAWGRVLVELAQSQTFRRRLAPLDPMFQVLGPDHRLDIPPDPSLFTREIEREFPAVRRVIDDLYTELAKVNARTDAAFERDAVWPPGGFWERRETGRVLATLPYLDGAADFLAEFPIGHPFRDVVTTSARFASDLAEGEPPFAVARLHGAWTRGTSHLAGGEEELVDFLVERIRAHGGDVRFSERAASLVHKGGKVCGVLVDGDEFPVGATFVVANAPSSRLLELAPAFAPPRESIVAVEPAEQRFVVSLVAASAGIPKALATDAFVLPRGDASRAVRLQRMASPAAGTELLVAETILPSMAPLDDAREAVLETVLAHLPFLERHLVLCDSPHDGRPLWDFRTKNPIDPLVGKPEWGLRAELVDRARLRATGGSLEAEPPIVRWRVNAPDLHGLAGEPIRTALGNVFVAGPSVLPALGQEGELLAAWGVARVVTRTDRRREKMLREMWSKVELS